eukprot:gnl/TRDRNA2_/TRDRNA2_127731_c0_seq4.p2 gnl/TRDRNA2_/TRDRNA2_127731_c0~~gnl/TRDRNA2_/TRDRNA2_127731_c0_seq4.p2  ORF type:complete len:105 (+),score=17.16 gnl/TRDRNA2_/TRDRNA2_127731_c0_seq4:166-480(+)
MHTFHDSGAAIAIWSFLLSGARRRAVCKCCVAGARHRGSIMSLQMEEEMRVQRAIAISQEEEDIRKATAASLLDRHQSCNMRSRWSACLPACHCLSSLLEVWRK